jgi:hypothetical protein
LAIEIHNTQSMQLSESRFFHKVGTISVYRLAIPEEAISAERPGYGVPRLATFDDLEPIIEFLNTSNTFPLTGGLYYAGMAAQPISESLLTEKIALGQLTLLQRWERIEGLAIAEEYQNEWGRQLSVGYIDGTAIDAVSLLVYDLIKHVSDNTLDNITIYTPDLVFLHDALSGLDFERDDEIFFSYERALL